MYLTYTFIILHFVSCFKGFKQKYILFLHKYKAVKNLYGKFNANSKLQINIAIVNLGKYLKPIDNNSSKVYNISNILNAMRELSEDDWLREKTVGESLSMKLGG